MRRRSGWAQVHDMSLAMLGHHDTNASESIHSVCKRLGFYLLPPARAIAKFVNWALTKYRDSRERFMVQMQALVREKKFDGTMPLPGTRAHERVFTALRGEEQFAVTSLVEQRSMADLLEVPELLLEEQAAPHMFVCESDGAHYIVDTVAKTCDCGIPQCWQVF
jgi:hypothetical protein